MSVVFAISAVALLAFAAWRDLATRTIPNGVSLALAGIGAAVRLSEGLDALAWSATVALAVGLLLALLHARGMLGGGDVKLLTALAIGLSPIDTWNMVVATALAGGVLGLLYLLLQRLVPAIPLRAQRSDARWLRRFITVEAWRIRRRGPLPYGVAIAAGGTFVIMLSTAS